MAARGSLSEGHRERLRTRFAKSGLDTFAEYEVAEILLTLLIPRRDVKPAAKYLINRFGNLRGVLDATSDALSDTPGIGPSTATKIVILRQILDRYLQQRATASHPLADSQVLEEYFRVRIGKLTVETFRVAFLDTAYRLLTDEELERGTVDRASVYPRQVIDAAMRHGASRLVLAHNHPNGDVQPSEQDKTLTRAIVLAGAPLDIEVFDHFIVSANDVFSFRKAGLL